MVALPPPPAPLRPLGDRARASADRRHCGPQTAKAGLGWTRRDHWLLLPRDPAHFGAKRVATFLHAIAFGPHGSASSQDEAPSALLTLDRDVCRPELQRRAAPVRASRSQSVPVMRSRDAVRAVRDPGDGVNRRMAALHSGAGPRRKSRCRLREKHVDLGRRQLVARRWKADQDRVPWLPGPFPAPLRAHLDAAREQHHADIAQGAGRVVRPHGPDRERPREGQACTWRWVCPSTPTFPERATGRKRRHHFPETGRGIPKRARCHAFMRSFAPHLLKHGTGIRPLQELLGHVGVSPTVVYTPVQERGPLDGRRPGERWATFCRRALRSGMPVRRTRPRFLGATAKSSRRRRLGSEMPCDAGWDRLRADVRCAAWRGYAGLSNSR